MAANSKASGFSWADEVEKEEAEAQARLQGPQKSNPFGSARPREIGFSWADEVEKEEAEAQAQLQSPQKANPFGSARPREIGFSWADEVEKEEAEAQAQLQGPQKSNPFGSARPREIGFSWADEVEKEEAEAQAQLQGPQKSNPFGSARPREIVLQEKGISWRKPGEQLESSNIRKEKQPAATQSANLQKKHSSRSGILAPYPPQIQQMICPAVCIKQHIHNSSVPPLRYPPKNAVALMENGSQQLCVFRLAASEGEKENYQNICGYISGQPIQPSNVHGMRGWEEQENVKSECGREFFGNALSNPPAELQMNRGSMLGAGFRGNIDGGSTFAIKNIEESNFNCGNPRGGQSNMRRGDAARNYKNRAGRLANEEASSVNTVSKIFEGNYKKRGQIVSAAGINTCQQRRRR